MQLSARAAALAAVLAFACAAPAAAQTYTGPIIQTQATAPISTAGSGDTLLLAGIAGYAIKVTGWDLYAGGTTAGKFFSATAGSNCVSGKVDLTGAYPFKDQGGLARGDGLGSVLNVPLGKDLCYNNSLAIQVSGSFSYAYVDH